MDYRAEIRSAIGETYLIKQTTVRAFEIWLGRTYLGLIVAHPKDPNTWAVTQEQLPDDDSTLYARGKLARQFKQHVALLGKG